MTAQSSTDHPSPPTAGHHGQRAGHPRPPLGRSGRVAGVVATGWSVIYLCLGVGWLLGMGGNPADPAVDTAEDLSLLRTMGSTAGAVVIVVLAGTGVVLSVLMSAARRHPAWRGAGIGRVVSWVGFGLAVTSAAVLPDFRLLATVGYLPMLGVAALIGKWPDEAEVFPWPVLNMLILSIAGIAWAVTTVRYRRSLPDARRRRSLPPPARARWAVAVAVAIPVGYAITRFAWALGVPLGVSQNLLDELGSGAIVGAGVGVFAVVGAVLTLGLVQHWGEVFPRWIPGLRGRRVPAAVVPAVLVAVVVTSAGLMFVRFVVFGDLGSHFPGENSDVAAWLPELFWPFWGVALAIAAHDYARRRA